MKKINLLFALVVVTAFFFGCQDSTSINEPVYKQTFAENTFSADGYTITLVSHDKNADGNWEWIWTIKNNNPGNGNNGTYQNLSHWVFEPGTCLMAEDIVSAAHSGNGTDFTEILAPYNFQPDPSFANTCGIETGNVFKFNFGTDGSNLSYYKLVVNKNFDVNTDAVAYLKSGNNTGCGTMNFDGIGCETTEKCYNYDCQTGFGGETVGSGSAWWFAYDTSVGGVQTIYAGQNMNAGTVEYKDGKIEITLAEGWSLKEFEWMKDKKNEDICGEATDSPYLEPVKIQGYETLPYSRPSAGKFTTYKGTSLNPDVTSSNYYVIHLDLVQKYEVDCSE